MTSTIREVRTNNGIDRIVAPPVLIADVPTGIFYKDQPLEICINPINTDNAKCVLQGRVYAVASNIVYVSCGGLIVRCEGNASVGDFVTLGLS